MRVQGCVQRTSSNLLQDTGQVARGAFQRVVLRRLLDVVEPRVYFSLQRHHHRVQTMSVSAARHGMGARPKDGSCSALTAQLPQVVMLTLAGLKSVRPKPWYSPSTL